MKTETEPVRETLAALRKLLADPPQDERRLGTEFFLTPSKLFARSEEILLEPDLVSEIIDLAGEVNHFRGKSRQRAIRAMSSLLSLLAMEAEPALNLQRESQGEPPPEGEGDGRGAASAQGERQERLRESVRRLVAQAVDLIQGGRSRSALTSELKGGAWERLGMLGRVGSDPAILAMILEGARDAKLPPRERQCAIEALAEWVGQDEPDRDIVETLDLVVEGAADRHLLVSALQLQVDFGLISELGALAAVSDFDDRQT